MKKKYIHYCWFGDKKIPRKFKKYMKTWKKYLPDYEIKEWNEKNFDINMMPYTKKAYENKKWAFVSDVARVYALKEYGGIYFDTDMEIIKPIDFLLDNDFWIGKEDAKYVACGAIGVKNKNNKIMNKIFNTYKKMEFDPNDMFKTTSPKIFTKCLEDIGLEDKNENQILNNSVHIYSREYFYPESYDGLTQVFTDNTCMIHHYSGSWTSIDEKIAIWFVRHHMGKLSGLTFKFFNILRKVKRKITR